MKDFIRCLKERSFLPALLALGSSALACATARSVFGEAGGAPSTAALSASPYGTRGATESEITGTTQLAVATETVGATRAAYKVVPLSGASTAPAAKRLASFEIVDTAHGVTVTDLALCPDGSCLAVARASAPVEVWSTRTGKSTARLKRAPATGHALAFAPDGTLAIAGGKSEVVFWNPRGGQPRAVANPDSSEAHVIGLSTDGSLYAAADHDNRAWSGGVRKAGGAMSIKASEVRLFHNRSLTFIPNVAQYLIAGEDHLSLWRASTGEMVGYWPADAILPDLAGEAFKRAAVSASGDEIAVGAFFAQGLGAPASGGVVIYAYDKAEPLRILQTPKRVDDVVYTARGRLVVSGEQLAEAFVVDPSSGAVAARLGGPNVVRVAASSDGTVAAATQEARDRVVFTIWKLP